MVVKVPRKRNIQGTQQVRIIPSRFPPVTLFETLVEADELEVLYAIESMSNDRIQAQLGNLHLLPKQDWVTGPGATVVMAAFTHIGRTSRFSNGGYGVYYASLDEDTAVTETVFHTERRLQDTAEPAIEIDMRCYIGVVNEALEDIRGAAYRELQNPDLKTWASCQSFGANRRQAGAQGLFYRSARRTRGECIATFRPRAVSLPVQGKHLRYRWNGTRVDSVLTISEIREL